MTEKESAERERQNKILEDYKTSMTQVKLVSAGHRIEIESNLTVCPRCEKKSCDIAKRRLNTAYTEDKENWLESCLDCYEGVVEHYRDMWNEYYNSQGV